MRRSSTRAALWGALIAVFVAGTPIQLAAQGGTGTVDIRAGRTVTKTFPAGTHYEGPAYGRDVNLPVPESEGINPNFPACTNRPP